MNNHSRNGPESPGMTSDDAEVWHHVTRTIKPLRNPLDHQHSPDSVSSDLRDSQSTTVFSDDMDGPVDSPPSAISRNTASSTAQDLENPLIMGKTPGLDRRAAAKLRRGQWPIEATLDLHGYRRDTARDAVEKFISQSAAQGRRCVLVVTGKGAAGDVQTGWRGQGVLRAGLANWLNASSVRPLILAYTRAQPRDGGGGAFYVLLRRRRRE